MNEQKTVSKNKTLKFLYQLLPRYYDDEDETTAMDKLKKAIYQDTKRSSTIKTKLMKMEFDVERYPKKQIFIFYLTYLQLVHTNRPFVERAHQRKSMEAKQPNQKLVSNILKFDMDHRFRKVGVQFLIAYELYQNLEKEDLDEKQFVEAYNDFLVFMHLQIKEFLKAKGEPALDSSGLEQKAKAIKRTEDKVVLSNHVRRYRQEEGEIKKQMAWVHQLNQHGARYDQVSTIAQGHLSRYGRELGSGISRVYYLIFHVRHFSMISEALNMRVFWEEEETEASNMREQFLDFLARQIGFVGDAVSRTRETIRANILLDFGARMLFQQERSEALCQMELLKGLAQESNGEPNAHVGCQPDVRPGQLDDTTLSGMTTEELLGLIIPEESRRPKGIRNSIREKTRDTIRVLERLKEKYQIVQGTRDPHYVKAMYEELYQYNEYHYKNTQGYSGIIKHVKAGTASPGELLTLKEKQIRSLFRTRGLIDRYPDYVDEQIISLKSLVEIYASFEHWMEG